MKKLLTSRHGLAVSILLGSGACAFGQSLGSPTSSNVWIGRPLEITVPARLPSGELRDDCVQADVFFGDNRLPRGQVKATVLGADDQKRVRIETRVPIDEPTVTVSLRAGCSASITRSYTLLPDMPGEAVVAGMVAPSPAALGAPPVAVTSPLKLSTAAPARLPSLRAARMPTAEAPAPRMRAARSLPAREAAGGGARLRLDAIDASPSALLRVSASLADPAGDAARRATSALLWQAINADPAEILRTSAMIQKLEGDLAQLRQSAGQTRTEMAALRTRLDEAQPWYLSPLLVQVLGLLVLAAAAAAGVLWYRTRGLARDAWYAPAPDSTLDSRLEPTPQAGSFDAVPPAAVVVPPPRAPSVPMKRDRGVVRDEPEPLLPDLEIPGAAVAASAVPVAPAASETGPIEFEIPVMPHAAAPRRETSGVMRVETLAATFEEVEFLTSLGLAGDAIDVLKAYLADSRQPAPLAFFELMRLCEQQDDAQATESARKRYAKVFEMEPPRLDQVTQPLGLDSQPDLSQRITQAWGRHEALDLIEEALFSVPQPGATLTLLAGRDLICLYDVAMTLLAEASSLPIPQEGEGQPLAPWAHADNAAGARMLAQQAAEPVGGDHFALDFDLDSAAHALPQDASGFGELRLEPLPEAHLDAAAAATPPIPDAAGPADVDDAFSAAIASERGRL